MAKSKKSSTGASYQAASYRILDDVMDVAVALLRSRKELGARKLQTLAEATRSYAGSMADLPSLRDQALSASKNIEHFADYVMNTDVHHMVDDATVLARRRPFLTLGIAAAAGLAATRLIFDGHSAPAAARPKKRSARKSGKASKIKVAVRRASNGAAHAHA